MTSHPLYSLTSKTQESMEVFNTDSICYSFQKHFIAQRRSFYHADKVIEMNCTSFRPSIINLNPTKLASFQKYVHI